MPSLPCTRTHPPGEAGGIPAPGGPLVQREHSVHLNSWPLRASLALRPLRSPRPDIERFLIAALSCVAPYCLTATRRAWNWRSIPRCLYHSLVSSPPKWGLVEPRKQTVMDDCLHPATTQRSTLQAAAPAAAWFEVVPAVLLAVCRSSWAPGPTGHRRIRPCPAASRTGGNAGA